MNTGYVEDLVGDWCIEVIQEVVDGNGIDQTFDAIKLTVTAPCTENTVTSPTVATMTVMEDSEDTQTFADAVDTVDVA